MSDERNREMPEGYSELGDEVLCGANSYEEKYYLNPKFDSLPSQVKDELKILCVLFAEEAGGILTLEFQKDGSLVLRTRADDYDFYYDEIEAGLQVKKVREEKEELLESLELYYRTFFMKETE